MEILAAYDLTRSYRDATKICGVSHNTVRSYVKARQEGAQAPVARQRGRMTDPFLPQMISWVDGVKTVLFVAWLAFSRFRIVIALRDKTLPSVFAALDRSFRLAGGVTTYVLTDNEKTVTIEHIAGIPVRNHQIVAFSRHYSTSMQTCIPADPASKGGVENAVKIAKADLVPKETNLLPEYGSFAELEAACEAFMEEVNSRCTGPRWRSPRTCFGLSNVPGCIRSRKPR